MLITAIQAALLLADPCLAADRQPGYILEGSSWSVRVVPDRLSLYGRLPGRSEEVVIAEPTAEAWRVENLSRNGSGLSWEVPDKALNVRIVVAGSRVEAVFSSRNGGRIDWPATAADPDAQAILYPIGEGVYAPVSDPFWLKELSGECRNAHGGLSLPFWGVHFGEFSLAYLLPNDLRAEVCLESRGGRLSARGSYIFEPREGLQPYRVVIALADRSAVGPARAYRDWLIGAGGHVPLSQKRLWVPESDKLFGAIHAYLWGSGRVPQAVEALKALGVERAALFYSPDKLFDASGLIGAALASGYLIGPYDSLTNVQDPGKADEIGSVFNEELYRNGGVMKADGKRRGGFAGRGFELSSEALRRSSRPFLAERVAGYLKQGVNGYFLDCDAAGELYDDYDPAHPMTQAKDRDNRLERLRFVSRGKALVLGSESAAAWSVPALFFSHGPHPNSRVWWDFYGRKNEFGGWWPTERPAHFFKRLDAGSELITAEFDPRYQVPLYQTVFHDSIVTTDRWELSLAKLPDLARQRSLSTLLYNVPTIWNLDLRSIREEAMRLRALYAFFGPIHRLAGDKPLTDFAWLTEDRLVQRTRFGDEVELAANFRDESFEGIPAGCIEARWLKQGRRTEYCPIASK